MENPIKDPFKYILPAALVAVIVITTVVFFSKSKSPVESETTNNPAMRAATPPALSPAEAKEAATSLKKMTMVLFEYTANDKKLEDLVENLRTQNQEPFTVRDKNKYTGEMVIVRTKNPPPGTRYFHAQYFSDEDNERFPQHMSFEFRSSPEAMTQAIQAVQEAFPNLGAPTHQSPDFIQWDLENDRVIWIKRLGYTDISENPFNAYTEADLGDIRMAIELRLEGH